MNNILEEVLYSNQDIVNRSEELGNEITKDYENLNPIVIGLLKGSVPFMAELIKHIKCEMEIDFMQVSSYEGTKSTCEVRVIKNVGSNVTNRHLIIVEDIIDTGLTLNKVVELLEELHPASIEIVTLLDKKEGRTVLSPTPKYVGFTIPNKFVVGFGLDYNQRFRNLDCIGVLKKEVYMKGE